MHVYIWKPHNAGLAQVIRCKAAVHAILTGKGTHAVERCVKSRPLESGAQHHYPESKGCGVGITLGGSKKGTHTVRGDAAIAGRRGTRHVAGPMATADDAAQAGASELAGLPRERGIADTRPRQACCMGPRCGTEREGLWDVFEGAYYQGTRSK